MEAASPSIPSDVQLASTTSSCPHLTPLCTSLGLRRLSVAAEFVFSSIHRPCIAATPILVPRCMHSTKCQRPTTNDVAVCIECVYIACYQHLRRSCGHKIFLSVEYGRLFCVVCQDFVHNMFMDAAIDLQREVAISGRRLFVESESWIDAPRLDDTFGLVGNEKDQGDDQNVNKMVLRKRTLIRGGGKKKKRMKKAASWVPTKAELSLIKSQCMGRVYRLAATTKPVGLFNLGNSCYMNAVLQAFLNAPPLRSFFLADGHRPACSHEPKRDCLACAFDELVCDSMTEELDLDSNNSTGQVSGNGKEKKEEKRHRRWFLIPQRALDIVWRYADNLASYAQHDAHEFLITALNILNAHMRLGNHQQSGTGGERSVPLSPVSNARAGRRTPTSPTQAPQQSSPSIVQSFFSGTLQSDVICRKCGNSSSTQEKFYDISLDVDKFVPPSTPKKRTASSSEKNGSVDAPADPQTTSASSPSDNPSRSPTPATSDTTTNDGGPANSVKDCLARFTEPEMLGAGSKLFCPICKSQQEAMKQMSIRTLPPILCLHFKRFEQTFAKIRRSEMVKIENAVEFPVDSLDLGPFLTSAILKKRFGLSAEQDEATKSAILSSQSNGDTGISDRPHLVNSKVRTDENSLYDLFAVVNHSGKIDRGHYTTLIRRRGHWFRCDDEKVSSVMKMPGVIRSEHAYLLFYVQRNPHFQY